MSNPRMNFRRPLAMLLLFCLLHMQQAGLLHTLAHAHLIEGGALALLSEAPLSGADPDQAPDKSRAAHSCLAFDALTLAHCFGASFTPSFELALANLPFSGPDDLAPGLPFLPPFLGRAPPLS
ncbi:MAG: hypothetical protein FWD77_12060 [Betaproteobacteria bacterium]|nr:hypothetical protein [Betaproteobacteria bacterium]